MPSDRRKGIHPPVRDGLWSLGKRRGVYEAFRYIDPEKTRRERRTLNTSSEQEASDLLRQLNDEVVAGGPATVATCFELYKFHKEQKKKWTESMERARKKVCAEIGDINPHAITRALCEQIIEKRLALGLARDTVRIEMAYLRAALSSSPGERAPTPSAPTGWKLAPVEPTLGMIAAGVDARDTPGRVGRVRDVYCAMLSASPSPEDTT